LSHLPEAGIATKHEAGESRRQAFSLAPALRRMKLSLIDSRG
jgi:hypothetical protein